MSVTGVPGSSDPTAGADMDRRRGGHPGEAHRRCRPAHRPQSTGEEEAATGSASNGHQSIGAVEPPIHRMCVRACLLPPIPLLRSLHLS